MSSQTVFRLTLRDGFDGLQAFKEPIPTVGKYEVLVKVRSDALNYRDVAIATSIYPLPVKDQVIPCSDMAGEVAQVGDLVNGFSVGDSVLAPINLSFLYGPLKDASDTFGGPKDGMLREYIALPAHAIIKLPKSSHSFTQWAAVVTTGSTVWNAFYGNTPLKPGETVLLLGMIV
jgi:NADPH:quinone reductase-like Zn-dependent oxidoreductase